MYSITMRKIGSTDETLIYSDNYPTEDTTITNVTLTMEVNHAGSLSITIPPTNVGYSEITHLTTELIVYRNENQTMKEMWRGRVIMEDKDFWNNRVLTCEGELAYLNDVIQNPREFKNRTLRTFIYDVLAHYDAQVETDDMKFFCGNVTVDNSTKAYRSTNYENTLTSLTDLLEVYGGHFSIRHESDGRYLDYLADYNIPEDELEIRFGSNLLDISESYDLGEFATAVIPLGAKLEESRFERLDEYLTVSSVNHGNIRIINVGANLLYGRKEKVLNYDDVEDASDLYNLGYEYLNSVQFDNVELEVSAVDLHFIDATVDPINLLDIVHVISPPHNMDKYLPVTKLEIPLNSPQDMTITINGSIDGITTKMPISKKTANLTKKATKK